MKKKEYNEPAMNVITWQPCSKLLTGSLTVDVDGLTEIDDGSTELNSRLFSDFWEDDLSIVENN